MVETVMNKETKKLWAKKTFELTNIGAGVLLFGQLVSNTGPKVPAIVGGLGLIVLGYFVSYTFLRTQWRKKND